MTCLVSRRAITRFVLVGGLATSLGAAIVRIALADDKPWERDRELAKLAMERDRELAKARAEYEREIAEAERDAYKEQDPYKATAKRSEKLREAEFRYREKIDKIGENYVEIPIEAWIYNFGPNKLMHRVVFEAGYVVEIETLGYGYIK